MSAELVATERPGAESRLRGEIVGLAGELTDATRKLQSALRVKERLGLLLDTTLESMDAGVVLVGPAGELLAVNGAARRMGAVIAAPSGAEGTVQLAEPVRIAVDRGEEILRPQGEEGSVWDVRASRVALPGGGRGSVLLIQDVTRSYRFEEQAHRRSRLELLGRMSAELAHEIRNPLGSLELFASMLVDDLDEMPESRELAEQLLVGVRRLGGTVNRLLGASRGRSAMVAPCDLAGLCRETAELLRPVAFARGIEIEAPDESATLTWSVDAGGLRQSVLNLIGNALDVTPEGGRIRARVTREGDRAVIEVADSGPGVAAELRKKIFEPFFSTREEGTGLGLSVVERVALAHGGTASVKQSELGGALFRLVLGVVRRDES